jgi:PTH1 family peptidyl-tRNA hydrolase
MKLVVALGNPDPEYTGTRHNVGRAAVTYWLENQSSNDTFWNNLKQVFTGPEQKRVNVPHFKGTVYKIASDYCPASIVSTDLGCYMNQSGESVQKLLKYFKIQPNDLVIVHDEIDLPLGEVRVSTNSSPGGHNGVKSIIQHIGTQNFTRIRLGIENRTKTRIPPTDKYVLQHFKPEEEAEVLGLLNRAVNELDNLL